MELRILNHTEQEVGKKKSENLCPRKGGDSGSTAGNAQPANCEIHDSAELGRCLRMRIKRKSTSRIRLTQVSLPVERAIGVHVLTVENCEIENAWTVDSGFGVGGNFYAVFSIMPEETTQFPLFMHSYASILSRIFKYEIMY